LREEGANTVTKQIEIAFRTNHTLVLLLEHKELISALSRQQEKVGEVMVVAHAFLTIISDSTSTLVLVVSCSVAYAVYCN
jgi:hypothetical protein